MSLAIKLCASLSQAMVLYIQTLHPHNPHSIPCIELLIVISTLFQYLVSASEARAELGICRDQPEVQNEPSN